MPDKMLGIIFVVHTSIGGDKLVFRYPTVSRSKISDETLLAFKQSHPQFTPDHTHLHNNEKHTHQNAPSSSRDKYYSYNMPSVLLAPILTPKTQLCDQSFELTIEDTLFIGHPHLLSHKTDNTRSQSDKKLDSKYKESLDSDCECGESAETTKGDDYKNGDDDKNGKGSDDLRIFNVIFTLSAYNQQVKEDIPVYKAIAAQVAAALHHEQLRCGYLSEQVHTMLQVREQWLTEQARGNSLRPDHHVLTDRLIFSSRLAEEIKDIYWGLVTHRTSCVRVNGWVNLHLTLRNPLQHSLLPMRPYHTLLLLERGDYDEYGKEVFSLSELPDSSPLLKRFIDVAKPTKGFRELQVETDIPLSQLYRMAAHLVFWGKAKVIDIMTTNNIYVLTPHIRLLQFQSRRPIISSNPEHVHNFNSTTQTAGIDFMSLSRKFARSFPEFKLAEILASFSTPKPLKQHIDLQPQSLHRAFVQAVGWLLQRDLLCQLHTYLHLVIPLPSETESHSSSSTFTQASTTPRTPTFVLEPIPLLPYEHKYLAQLDDRSDLFQSFFSLCPYFRGKHHLEEIMWRMNVSRDLLFNIMKKYKDILVQVIHEGDDLNTNLKH